MTAQPTILAISEPWGLYATAAVTDPDRLTRQPMTLKQARDLVRRIPANQRPSIIPDLTELARRLTLAGVSKPQPVAIYRVNQRGNRAGNVSGAWHQFTFTPNA